MNKALFSILCLHSLQQQPSIHATVDYYGPSDCRIFPNSYSSITSEFSIRSWLILYAIFVLLEFLSKSVHPFVISGSHQPPHHHHHCPSSVSSLSLFRTADLLLLLHFVLRLHTQKMIFNVKQIIVKEHISRK